MHGNKGIVFVKSKSLKIKELQEIMDSILGVEIKKSKKSNHEGPNNISYLPEVIIGRILFFLPNKVAVRTSVLSKRWM
uniref:F-box domain-containing protein n=1 Tax=Glycine max TaxID=3847 RepID=A0A0R0GCP6_SOYBN